MPLKIGQAYSRARQNLSPERLLRLQQILEQDPKMARFLNQYGMENAANSPFPIAVVPPERFLQLARKYEDGSDETGNLAGLLHRIQRDQPDAREMDLWSEDTTPDFLKGFLKHNRRSPSSDIYYHKGIGLPRGYDKHPDVSMFGDSDEWPHDTGGLPLLKWTPRGEHAISITDHEGRGRNAFAAHEGFSLPTQMMERSAVLPDDPYVNSSNIEDMLRRLGRGTQASNEEASIRLNAMREPVSIRADPNDVDPMGLDKEREFLNQITRAVPEDFIRYGVNRRGEYGGRPLSVPWNYPSFAEGGEVKGYDHGGPYEREYQHPDLTMAGSLADVSDKLGVLGAPGQALSDIIKQFGAGALSQVYGVDRDTGEVGLGKGGAGGIGALNDTKGLGAAWSDHPIDSPLNPGYQTMRMQDELHNRMRLHDDPDMPERLANMAGAIAGQVPTFLLSDGASTPAIVGSTLAKAGRVIQPIVDLANRAPSALKSVAKGLNYATEALTPVNNVGVKPGHLLPASGIGEGISQVLNQGIEASADPMVKFEMEINDTYGDPDKFMAALQSGDPRAQDLAHKYDRLRKAEQNRKDYAEYLYDAH
jgi:hypothetical protein